ncbi:hypothetical protein [Cupriavidus gilardii]|uniref:hypothetical protein n=1 Tax=Cupriavidus gilardii TaxID=82541 RepID=UPI0015738F8D|nr:hypothetical protein [Cupriavidus gilardii]NSX04884.1 hypothetical protein [Cupriavidus gilardii]
MDDSTTRLPSFGKNASDDSLSDSPTPSSAMTFFTAGRLSGLAPTYFDAVLNTRLGLAHGRNILSVLLHLHHRFVDNAEKLTVNHAVLSFDDIAADASLSAEGKGALVLERIAARLTGTLACHADERAAAVCAREVAALLGDRAFQELETEALAQATGTGPMEPDTAGLTRRHGTNIALDGGRISIHKTTDWMHRDPLTQRAVLTSDIVLSLQLERADNVVAQAAGVIRRKLGEQGIANHYQLTAAVTGCCLSSDDSSVQKELDTVHAGFWDRVKTLLEHLLGVAGICFHPIKPWRKLELLETRPRALNETLQPHGACGQGQRTWLEVGQPTPKGIWLRSHRTDGWGQTKPNASVGVEVGHEAATRQDGLQTVDAALRALERERANAARHAEAPPQPPLRPQAEGQAQAAAEPAAEHAEAGAPRAAQFAEAAPATQIAGPGVPVPELVPATASSHAQLTDEEAAALTQNAYFRHLATLYGDEAAMAAVDGARLRAGELPTPEEIERMERVASSFSGVGSAKQLAHVLVVDIWPQNVRHGNYGHAAATIRGPRVVADGPSGLQAWPKTHHSLWPAEPPLTLLTSVESFVSRSYRADKYNMVSDRAAEGLSSGAYDLRPAQKLYTVGGQTRAAVSANKVYLPLFGQNALDDRTAAARPCLFGLSARRMRDRWQATSQAEFRLWSMKNNCAGSVLAMLRAGGAQIFARKPTNYRGGMLPTDAQKYAAQVASEIDGLNQRADKLIDIYRTEYKGNADVSLEEAWQHYVERHNDKLQSLLTRAEVHSDDPLVLMKAARRLLKERDLERRPDALGVLCGLRNRMCELSQADRGATSAPPALGMLSGLA